MLFGFLVILAATSFNACQNKIKPESESQKALPNKTQNTTTMKSYLSIFEIPATDISRAIDFYQAILGINIQHMEFSGMEMGLLPFEDQVVTGVIIKGAGSEPSANGITIYLDAGNDLQLFLDKVEPNGGEVLVPKTPHADESGFFALFLDSEGNKMGLHSLN